MNVPRAAKVMSLWDDGYSEGYAAALNAAREAVAALHSDRTPIRAGFRRALDAIDALRKETK